MTPAPTPVAVLVVDGDEENLVALTALLERDGVRVFTARSGPEALEALRVHDVALALVDVSAPGMDGFGLAALMRGGERTRAVPIIFVTDVSGEPARIFAGYDTGAVDFLLKPVEPTLLRSKVDTFVELHRQRRQMSEQQAQLQELRRLSDVFVAVLGHDLRSPLQSIELGAQVILGKPDDAVVAQRMANTMQRASRRMARLIEELLDFARARLRGAIPILTAPCDLADITRTAIAELEPAASARVDLRLAGDQHGTWDRDRILQVLGNLLGNAVEHGEPAAPITVLVDGESDAVRIEIRNAGHVAPELLPSIFDPFVCVERGPRKTRGLGLGLYLVDQIVKAHGGRVQVESTPETGTTVRVELPRVSVDAGVE